jgi:hypothetical protein
MVFTIAAICLVASAGTFGQSLHFLGNHREAAAGIACGSRLNGGVQGQHVGLFGNV